MNNFFQRTKTACVILGIAFFIFLLPAIFSVYFFLILLCFVLYFEWSVICTKQPLFYFLTPLYPLFPFVILIRFSMIEYGKVLICVLFLFTSMFDTACYIMGHLFGRTPLLPSISPKKTVEGFLGGIMTVFIIGFIIAYLLKIDSKMSFLLIITSIALVSVVGDLFESLIKRQVHMKDSGNLLPGHGGILDRIDSLLFVVVYFYFFQNTFSFCLNFL